MIRINPVTMDAEMVRGDTGTFSIRPKIKGENVLQDGDVVWFTLRKLQDRAILLQKQVTEFEDGIAVIPIEPSDTAALEIGNYLYDLKLNRSDGNVDTLLPAGNDTAYFTIKRGVK